MLKIFRSFTPQTVILILLFTVLIKLGYILYPIDYQTYTESYRVDWLTLKIWHYFGPDSLVPLALGIITIALQSLLINRLCTEYKLFQQDSFIPAALFILLTSFSYGFNIISAPMLTSYLFLIVLNNMLRLQTTVMPRKLMFNNGLVIGLSAILYWPAAALTLFMWWAYVIIRKFRMQEFIASILGIATTVYTLAIILFLTDLDYNILTENVMLRKIPRIHLQNDLALKILCLSILSVTGFILLNNYFYKTVEYTKKLWWIIIIFTISGLTIPFLLWQPSGASWYTFLMPAALVASHIWLSDANKWLKILLFWLSLISVILIQYQLI